MADAYASHELTQRTAQEARMHHQLANFHLSAVQALNSCFPVGDTAERDDAG